MKKEQPRKSIRQHFFWGSKLSGMILGILILALQLGYVRPVKAESVSAPGGTITSTTTKAEIVEYFGGSASVDEGERIITLTSDITLSKTLQFADTVRIWKVDINTHSVNEVEAVESVTPFKVSAGELWIIGSGSIVGGKGKDLRGVGDSLDPVVHTPGASALEKEGTGKLIVSGGELTITGGKGGAYSTIDSLYGTTMGSLAGNGIVGAEIRGGTITVTGGEPGSNGGGDGLSGGVALKDCDIIGGNITATGGKGGFGDRDGAYKLGNGPGGMGGAGISGGTITGGTVTAIGGEDYEVYNTTFPSPGPGKGIDGTTINTSSYVKTDTITNEIFEKGLLYVGNDSKVLGDIKQTSDWPTTSGTMYILADSTLQILTGATARCTNLDIAATGQITGTGALEVSGEPTGSGVVAQEVALTIPIQEKLIHLTEGDIDYLSPYNPVFTVSIWGRSFTENTHYTTEYGSNDTIGTDAGSIVVTGTEELDNNLKLMGTYDKRFSLIDGGALYSIENGAITLREESGELQYKQGEGEWTTYSGSFRITGTISTESTNNIVVTSGTHDIILSGVNINNTTGPAFEIRKGATVNLTLAKGQTNKLQSGGNYAGLHVAGYVNIDADGSGANEGKLIATGSSTGSGIGVGNGSNVLGTVNICGGNIEAKTSGNGAGIGTGQSSNSSSAFIYISGGTIVATGGDGGAGIGAGQNSFIGTISISGGTITATGGRAYYGGGSGIGRGYRNKDKNGNCDLVLISGGTITATGGGNNQNTTKAAAVTANYISISPITSTAIFAQTGAFGAETTALAGSPFYRVDGGNNFTEIAGEVFTSKAENLYAIQADTGVTVTNTAETEVSTAFAGDTLTVTAADVAGYIISGVEVVRTGNEQTTIPVTRNAAGKYEFTMPAYGVTVKVVKQAIPPETPTATVEGITLEEGYLADSAKLTASLTAPEEGCEYTYQWYSNTAKSNKKGTLIKDATKESYVLLTGLKANTYYYYCEVTATRKDNKETAKGVTDVATVTITKKAQTPSSETTQTPSTSETIEEITNPEVVKQNAIVMNANTTAGWKKNKLKVTWATVENADGYEIYASKCSKEVKLTSKYKIATIQGNKTTSKLVSKIQNKKIKKTGTYKIQVKAYRFVENKKVYVASGLVMHIAGSKDKKYTNAKKVIPSRKKVTLKVGKTTKVKGKTVKLDKKKKLLPTKHTATIRYQTSDKTIATVSSKGKIKGIKKGSCYVYLIAMNGVNAKIKVTVK